ncbi:sensor histidine kinase [Ectobacillus panaciterrae]|uniref:sensor histidine kinase n=1 Tax=Ectobacillus panaciterrae TaxID=363872 RepID=UPI00040B63E6|nr:HAMP domain-containing sensor histidine kinase [Ectobacillus panaciterrae]
MDQVRDLWIQIAIIILPLFLYDAIRLNRYHVTLPKLNRSFLALLSAATVAICMTYPIDLGKGYTYEFHQIPIITAFLYGGIVGAVPALTSIFYYWFTHGTEFLWVRILDTIIISAIPFILSRKWEAFAKNKKIVISFMIASFYALIYLAANVFGVLITSGFTHGVSQIPAYYILSSVIMAVTLMFQVYITEYCYENAFLRAEMLKSEKLNIVSELAASVAHEVRNPLTVVRGFIQLLEGAEHTKNKEYMQLVLSELDRAEQIISDYLNLARPQIEQKEMISLTSQLIEMTTLMSSFAAMQGVYLQVEIAENLHTVGDKAKLKQAIMNIVKNGVEAIQENKGYLKVTAYQTGEEIVISVKDSGIGMTKEQLARLGQPYYSLKEKGTGLGLMVTFSIIQAHNGKIGYKSEVGNGTEAIIILPAANWKE